MRSQSDISTVEMFVYIGVFPTRAAGLAAVRDLRARGLPEDRVGILSKREPTTDGIGPDDDPTHSRWEEGAAVGAATGGLTGVGLGLAVAAGLIPAIGPAVVGGLFVALLASAGAGATLGTLVGGLIGLGVPEDEAGYYGEQVAAGRTIVAARTEGPAPWVPELFKKHGAIERGNLITEQPEPERSL
jgi:cytochrome c biogenesis protein CcdA